LRIIAHRTTSGVYPQNSIKSVLFLANNRIPAIEFDVCATNDGRFVVARPISLRRGTLETAVSLAQFLAVCRPLKVDMFLDLKFVDATLDQQQFLERLEQTIMKAGTGDHTVVISRSEKVLSQLRGRLLTGHIKSEIESESSCSCDMTLIPITKLSNSVVLGQKRIGNLVATKVDVSNIRLARDCKIENIMTDHAIEIRQMLQL
jgi:glycerophosphoryl diester phosphodiesterase